MSTEEKAFYEVQILRVDGKHIIATQSESYDECFERWESLQKEWVTSSNENRPFVLKEPQVTAFNPTLITEITLVPVVEQTANKYNNPYQKQMIDNGLTQTLNKIRGQSSTYGSELMDGGYQPDGGYK